MHIITIHKHNKKSGILLERRVHIINFLLPKSDPSLSLSIYIYIYLYNQKIFAIFMILTFEALNRTFNSQSPSSQHNLYDAASIGLF